MARLLITGGAGFIGSHTCVVLLQAGHELVVIDNFHNSCPEACRRVERLTGRTLVLEQADVRDGPRLNSVFDRHGRFDGVMHFAGLKAVGESVKEPLLYWHVNVCGSRTLLQAMAAHGCRTLVFSSSATLYGNPDSNPIAETAPIRPVNPYGQSKAAVERMSRDVAESQPDCKGWRLACLRYFNPVGAHPSGEIGEAPQGIPDNLFPFISQVAMGERSSLDVFGGDWPTPDGSGVRDYIHVMDLAAGHCVTLEHLLDGQPQLLTLNLGSGCGTSVLQALAAFERVVGRSIPHRIVARRPGDVAMTVADPGRAAAVLGWQTERTLAEMCADGWHWQQRNPLGFG